MTEAKATLPMIDHNDAQLDDVSAALNLQQIKHDQQVPVTTSASAASESLSGEAFGYFRCDSRAQFVAFDCDGSPRIAALRRDGRANFAASRRETSYRVPILSVGMRSNPSARLAHAEMTPHVRSGLPTPTIDAALVIRAREFSVYQACMVRI